jgi:hypothetical protein
MKYSNRRTCLAIILCRAAIVGIGSLPIVLYAQTQCNLMPITTAWIQSSKEASSAYDHMLCDSDFGTSQDATNAGVGLGAIVYGVPLQANTTFSSEKKNSWKKTHCESTHDSRHYASSYAAVLNLVSPEAYAAWRECVTASAYGFVCWLEKPSADNFELLTLRTRWNPLPNDRGGSPIAQSSTLLNGTVTGGTLVRKGVNLGNQPSMAIQRSAGGPAVVAVINSTRGSCTAYASAKPPALTWCDADPETKIPYSKTQTLEPSPNHMTLDAQGNRVKLGGDDKTPGNRWDLAFDAPGPVTSVNCKKTGGWEEVVDPGTAEGNHASCYGWINGSNAPIRFAVTWKQQCRAQQ